MGDKNLGADADGIKESSYSVISFPASKLPETYQNFVKSKWKRTLRHGNDYFKLTDSDSFFANYERFINHLLARASAVIRLAVLTEDPDVVLGFSLIEGNTLHYVYVQHEQRNRGIGRSLVPVKIEIITHLTKSGMSIWHNKLPTAAFDPFK